MVDRDSNLQGQSYLDEKYPAKFLADVIQDRDEWHPFPKITDRDAWEGLPATVKSAHVVLGEEAMNDSWPHLPASLYLQYARVGNRRQYEKPYFERRNALGWMVIAECIDNQGRFLDSIADAAWSICEESSWCIPAHISPQVAGVGLPDTTETIVDLFAAETGALMAWTVYLLGDRLDQVSPLVRPRIVREVHERILTPAITRDDYWWMGFTPRRVNNWNPWINSNWLTCALLVEQDPQRRITAISKILRSIDRFVVPYPKDGGCDEGPGYWGRAGASLFDNLELLLSASGGKIDVYSDPLIRDIGRFVYRAHIDGEYYVNFADAPARLIPEPAIVYQYGKRIDDPDMMAFGAWLANEKDVLANGYTTRGNNASSLGRVLPALFLIDEMMKVDAFQPQLRDVWLPEIQVMAARDQAGTSGGFYLAAKGGHNEESHNHNDVGHFIIYREGLPVIVDAGVETYTRKTFSDRRYEIWTMQSAYHSLPTIGGVMQSPGREFQATEVSYTADDALARLSLDISCAYPAEANIKYWKRQVVLRRGEAVELNDSYELTQPAREITLSLVTACEVDLSQPGVVQLTAAPLAEGRMSGAGKVLYEAGRFAAHSERIPITDERLMPIWGDHLTRIVFTMNAPKPKDSYTLQVTP